MTTTSDLSTPAWPGPAALAAGRRLIEAVMAGGERASSGRNALVAFGIRLVSAAILLLSQLALARWMGAHDYGSYIYAWTWVLVLGGFGTLGLSLASIRLVPQYRETGRLDALRGFLLGGRALALAISTGIAAAGSLVIAVLGSRLAPEQAETLAIALLALPAFALTDMHDGICRGSAAMLSGLLAPYVVRPLTVLVVLGIAHALGASLDAQYAIGIAVIATWVAFALQAAIVELRVLAPVPRGGRRYEPRVWLTASLPLQLIAACDIALQNTDVILLTHFKGAAAAGIYFAAAKIMGLIMFVHYAVGSAMASRFAALSARGEHDALSETVRDAVRWTFWPSLAVGLVMLTIGRPLLALFGPGFADGYPVMGILIVGFLVRASIGPADFLLNMSGHQGDCARALVIAALTNLVLDIALVPALGMVGAATAVATSLLTAALLNRRAVRNRLGIDVAIWAQARR